MTVGGAYLFNQAVHHQHWSVQIGGELQYMGGETEIEREREREREG